MPFPSLNTPMLLRALPMLLALLAVPAAAQEEEAAPVQLAMETNRGTIVLELYPDYAPVTVANFLGYVDSGFYDGLIFHRVIPNFMLQGGGFTRQFEQRETRAPIRNEADNELLNKRGTVAMARTSEVDSATSQFFINLKDNVFLDHGYRDFGYAVFGRVVGGMDVVDAIAASPTRRMGPHANVPVDSVVITSIARVPAETP